jgi:uncharacterized protein with GYD domain
MSDAARRPKDTLIYLLSHPFSPLMGVVKTMYFISLVKFKGMPTRDAIAANLKRMAAEEKTGIRYHSIFWTLGPYDAILTFEAPDEKAAMASSIHRRDFFEAHTLVAVPAEEARQLVE